MAEISNSPEVARNHAIVAPGGVPGGSRPFARQAFCDCSAGGVLLVPPGGCGQDRSLALVQHEGLCLLVRLLLSPATSINVQGPWCLGL